MLGKQTLLIVPLDLMQDGYFLVSSLSYAKEKKCLFSKKHQISCHSDLRELFCVNELVSYLLMTNILNILLLGMFLLFLNTYLIRKI